MCDYIRTKMGTFLINGGKVKIILSHLIENSSFSSVMANALSYCAIFGGVHLMSCRILLQISVFNFSLSSVEGSQKLFGSY